MKKEICVQIAREKGFITLQVQNSTLVNPFNAVVVTVPVCIVNGLIIVSNDFRLSLILEDSHF